ncbi:MAG: hypothetical protein K0R07_1226, partial [Sedimentibacter sp.]|nr:hypothetical protein [Sedimentibacter sp.]
MLSINPFYYDKKDYVFDFFTVLKKLRLEIISSIIIAIVKMEENMKDKVLILAI